MTDHGPKCLACVDPDKARALIAADRVELDQAAARAAEHRAAGERLREENYQTLISGGDTTDVQQCMLDELGTANGIAQAVMMHRAHLDRVEAAHPALTEEPAKGDAA